MKSITLKVNGKTVTRAVEPRTHLADFLREQLLLTGTHIGCEHGICGACTVDIQGEIARSCITYAVQCDGAEVTTIEGFDSDPLMIRLRHAFTTHHALQCGYCTPGMLIAARDLIRRHGDIDDMGIRGAMSGNLCRCTGYAGMVAAVRSVLAEGPDLSVLPPSGATVGPAPGADAARTEQITSKGPSSPQVAADGGAAPAGERVDQSGHRLLSIEDIGDNGLTRLQQEFTVKHPSDGVWTFLKDLQQVARCLPGAVITRVDGDRFEGEIRVKLGPIKTAFACEGLITRDEPSRQAIVIAQGRDAQSASRVKGRIDYSVLETEDGDTQIAVEVAYALAGALAQFGRGGLVTELVNRLTAEFARNMAARLGNKEVGGEELEDVLATLDAGGLFWSVLWARLKYTVRGLFGRH
ncbi:2Fe-2S iron-sulfur cluster-binding protein [Gammaproteobacteria bacterium]|nr:2Fe-2S iron-sulfur cluster-binding protein [Gammaproteobacteria bacterium]